MKPFAWRRPFRWWAVAAFLLAAFAAQPGNAADCPVGDLDCLVAKVETWRDEPQWAHEPAHAKKWNQVLALLGEDSSESPMAASLVRSRAEQWPTSRWAEVAAYLDWLAEEQKVPDGNVQASIGQGQNEQSLINVSCAPNTGSSSASDPKSRTTKSLRVVENPANRLNITWPEGFVGWCNWELHLSGHGDDQIWYTHGAMKMQYVGGTLRIHSEGTARYKWDDDTYNADHDGIPYTGATASGFTIVLNVEDDDEPATSIGWKNSFPGSQETTNPANMILQLTSRQTTDTTVLVSTENGTAIGGQDFTAFTNKSVVIPKGTKEKAVPVTYLDDKFREELLEEFKIRITSVNGTAVTNGAVQRAGILDDEEEWAGQNPVDVSCAPNTGSSSASDPKSRTTQFMTVKEHPAGTLTITWPEGFVGWCNWNNVIRAYNDQNVQAGQHILGPFKYAIGTDYTSLLVHSETTARYSEDDDVFDADPVKTAPKSVAGYTFRYRITENDIDPAHVGFAKTSYTVGEGDGTIDVGIKLSSVPLSDVSVFVSTKAGTATAGDDYEILTRHEVVIPKGQTSGTVTVTINEDVIDDEDETFSVGIIKVDGNAQMESGPETTVTITDNDEAGEYFFSKDSHEVWESPDGVNAGVARVTLNLKDERASPFTIRVNTVGKTASAPSDYTALTNHDVTFAAGETSKTVDIAIVDDAILEHDETFTVRMIRVGGQAITNGPETVVTILSDDITGSGDFNSGTIVVHESEDDVPFTFDLGKALPYDRTYTYRIDYLTASADDFDIVSDRRIVVKAGETSGTLVLDPVDDGPGDDNDLFRIYILPGDPVFDENGIVTGSTESWPAGASSYSDFFLREAAFTAPIGVRLEMVGPTTVTEGDPIEMRLVPSGPVHSPITVRTYVADYSRVYVETPGILSHRFKTSNTTPHPVTFEIPTIASSSPVNANQVMILMIGPEEGKQPYVTDPTIHHVTIGESPDHQAGIPIVAISTTPDDPVIEGEEMVVEVSAYTEISDTALCAKYLGPNWHKYNRDDNTDTCWLPGSDRNLEVSLYVEGDDRVSKGLHTVSIPRSMADVPFSSKGYLRLPVTDNDLKDGEGQVTVSLGTAGSDYLNYSSRSPFDFRRQSRTSATVGIQDNEPADIKEVTFFMDASDGAYDILGNRHDIPEGYDFVMCLAVPEDDHDPELPLHFVEFSMSWDKNTDLSQHRTSRQHRDGSFTRHAGELPDGIVQFGRGGTGGTNRHFGHAFYCKGTGFNLKTQDSRPGLDHVLTWTFDSDTLPEGYAFKGSNALTVRFVDDDIVRVKIAHDETMPSDARNRKVVENGGHADFTVQLEHALEEGEETYLDFGPPGRSGLIANTTRELLETGTDDGVRLESRAGGERLIFSGAGARTASVRVTAGLKDEEGNIDTLVPEHDLESLFNVFVLGGRNLSRSPVIYPEDGHPPEMATRRLSESLWPIDLTYDNFEWVVVDPARPAVSDIGFTRPFYAVNEENGPAQPVIALDQIATTDLDITFRVTEGTATSPEHFIVSVPDDPSEPFVKTSTLDTGERAQSFDVRTVVEDPNVPETTKTFTVAIESVTPSSGVKPVAERDRPQSATVYILDSQTVQDNAFSCTPAIVTGGGEITCRASWNPQLGYLPDSRIDVRFRLRNQDGYAIFNRNFADTSLPSDPHHEVEIDASIANGDTFVSFTIPTLDVDAASGSRIRASFPSRRTWDISDPNNEVLIRNNPVLPRSLLKTAYMDYVVTPDATALSVANITVPEPKVSDGPQSEEPVWIAVSPWTDSLTVENRWTKEKGYWLHLSTKSGTATWQDYGYLDPPPYGSEIFCNGSINSRTGERGCWADVVIFSDSHDEGDETFTLVVEGSDRMSPTTRAWLGVAEATVTIRNDGPMPAAWLARFGRTVAEQALDGIAGRMAAPRTPGMQGTLVGQALDFGAPSDAGSTQGDPAAPTLSDVAQAFGGHPVGPGSGLGEPPAQSRTLTARDALVASRFSLTGEEDGGGGSFAFWGRAAQARFDGREGTLSLDGEVTTAMLGADYARDQWLIGLALTQSTGEGGYRDTDAMRAGDGKVEASLTAAVPYALLEASQRLRIWTALGYGTGDVTLRTGMGERLEAGTDWQMAALGLRGDVFARAGGGPGLALTSDALWTRTQSAAVQGLASSDSSVTRLRLGLEGNWAVSLSGLGTLTPKLEMGLRHDGGDAETGFGVELGGGIAWLAPAYGLSLSLEGRTLVAHETDLEDSGVSVALSFDPDPASARGPSVSLRQSVGGSATGGVAALFGSQALVRRAGTGEMGGLLSAEASWGFATFGGRFTGSPHVSYALSDVTRDYTLGWRLEPVASAVSFGVAASQRERDGAATEHVVGLEVRSGW